MSVSALATMMLASVVLLTPAWRDLEGGTELQCKFLTIVERGKHQQRGRVQIELHARGDKGIPQHKGN